MMNSDKLPSHSDIPLRWVIVYFQRQILPLNIFEQRYLELVHACAKRQK